MLKRILGSRWLVSGTVVAVLLAFAVTVTGFSRLTVASMQYCADFADAVGVFPGNAVTRRGVTVGEVLAVESREGTARVRFSVEGTDPLPARIRASTVAPSVIAVRQVALIGDDEDGPALDPARCIGRDATNTPLSISASLNALSGLAGEMTGSGNLDDLRRVAGAMRSLDRELDGTGPVLNALIRQLAEPAKTPITGALTDTAVLIDNIAEMATGLDENWELLTSFITMSSPVLKPLVAPMIDHIGEMAMAMPDVIVLLADLMRRYGDFAWPPLEVVVSLVDLVSKNLTAGTDLLAATPVLSRAFTTGPDQKSLGLRIRYKGPTAVTRAGGKPVRMDAVAMVLQMTGAR